MKTKNLPTPDHHSFLFRALCTAALCLLSVAASAQDFSISTLTPNNAVAVDVNSLVGDDRGGIAVSGSQVFLSGDVTTGRFNRDTLGSGASLGTIRDGLVANLATSTVYLLGNASTPLPNGGGTFNSLIELNGATGAPSGTVINLSTPITLTGSSSSVGIFSGWNRVVVHNGTRAYRVSLPDGTVTDLGAMATPTRTASESWAYWGVAENVGSATRIVYVRNSTTISRTTVPGGVTSTVATFANLNDMASFTVSVAQNRWYFHHEGSSQFGAFSESLGYADATFVSAPVAPTIAVQPVAVSVIAGEAASLSVSASGTAPLTYQWYKDVGAGPVLIVGATASTYSIAVTTLGDAANYSVVVANGSGSVTSSTVALTVSPIDADLFKIIRLTANNAVVVDPLNYVGDDRGGLVATDQKIFLRGDDSVGSFNLSNLTGGIRLGTNFGALTNFFFYDSLVSDLRTQKAYVLDTGTTNIGIFGGTVARLVELHGSNGVPTGAVITLSTPIVMPGTGLYNANVGIFSGWGRIVLHNGTRAYSINTASGTVTDLGAMTFPTHINSESWASWGVAEYFGGSHYMVYARDAQSIVRTRIPDGATTVISSFANLNDLASFTVVPGLNRWYFHNETVNQFTNYANFGGEVLGYADAAFLFQQPAPAIVSQPQNLTVTVGSNASFSVTATGVGTLTYQWKTNGVVLAGATSSSVTFANAQLTDSGLIFSVTVSDGVTTPLVSGNATLTVLPNAAPTFTLPAPTTVNEDAGSQTNLVTAITAGAAHESAQTLTVTASSSNPGLTGPIAVSFANGIATLRYTNVANAFGSAIITVTVTDNGGTVSGGVDSTASGYLLTVTPVNDAPAVTFITNNVVVLEDAGPVSVPAYAAITFGPANEAGQLIIGSSVTAANPGLFSVPPAINPLTGELTFTPVANTNGATLVTVIVQDDGGTANGGMDSSTNTFTITIVAVNDAPTLTLGVTTVNVLTNAGAFTTNIAPVATVGPAAETSSQTIVGYVTSNNNPALFSVQPTLGLNGNLNFTVAGNVVGTAILSVQAQDSGDNLNGGTNRSAVVTVTINVSGPNIFPTFTLATNNLVVAEDSGSSSIISFLFGLSAGEVTQTVTNLTTSNNNSNLFSAQPVFTGSGATRTLTFTPAPDANGVATVTVSATDDGSSPATGTQTFTITVTPVNDAPSFALNAGVLPVVIAEDSGPQTVLAVATSISAGPANESAQTVTFITSNTGSNLFSAQPVISSAGTLTFTPAANAFGVVTVSATAVDSGGAPGVSNSAAQTFTITINNINDPPAISFATNNLVVLEDAGLITSNLFLSLSPGPFNEPGTVAITSVANNNAGLFSVAPAFDLAGNLTFTPAPDSNGVATVTVIAQDDTGLFSTNSFTLTVLPVNDAPSLTLTTTVFNVLTNSGGFSGNLGAVVTFGPPNEVNQAPASFLITNNNNALFTTQPSANQGGNLSFSVAPGQQGTATLYVRVQDTGGTANGGVDISSPVLVTVNVSPGNSAPSFTLGATSITKAEDSGTTTSNAFLTALSPGSQAFESSQVVTLTVVNNNSNLFSAQPTLIGSGATRDLTFTPLADANGVATVTITATDNGTPPLSAVQTVTITVTAVNDAPSFALNEAVLPIGAVGLVLAEDSGPQSLLLAVTNIFAGATNESAQVVTFITSNTASNIFSAQPVISSAGTLTFTTATNAFGVAVVTVIAVDSGGAPGVSNSAPQTFTITVTNVNDPPAITFATNNVVVLEDAGLVTSNLFLSISAGPFGEPGSASFVSMANNNPSLFTVGGQPAFTGGTLTFTPAPDSNGVATVTVIAQDDTLPVGLFGTNTFTITVLSVNDAPTLTLTNTPINVLTNSGGFSGLLGAITTVGPPNESSQTIIGYVITNNNPGLFTVQPTANSGGNLSFSIAPNQVGTALLSVFAQDSGGTANGGVDLSTAAVITVNVNPGNSAPSFTLAATSITKLEDSGTTTSNLFLTALSPGSQIFEAGQLVTVTTANNNSNLFSGQPVISGGTLTFTPAANANGVATLTVTATDNGAPPLSSSQTVTITVTAVNDQPSFTISVGLLAGPWQTAQAMAAARLNAVAGVIGTKIYHAGGLDAATAGSAQSSLLIYDTVAGTWSAGAPMPTPRYEAAGGVISGKLYVVGGWSPGLGSQVYEYDPGLGAWTTRASLPHLSAGGSAGVIAGKLYLTSPVFGGVGLSTAFDVYDPVADSWTSLAAATKRYHSAGAVVAGKFYLFGGHDEASAVQATADVFDPATGVWSPIAAMPVGRAWATAVELNGKVYLIGGVDGTGTALNAVAVYDPAGNSWQSLGAQPTARFAGAAAVVGRTIFYAGGAAGTVVTAEHQFLSDTSVVVSEDSGAQSFAGFAANLSVGPANESAQSLAFITSNTASNLFSAQPVIAANGTLSFTPALNANGSAIVSVQAQDNGGTANSGVDITAVQTFTITITPVNDPPTVTLATNLVALLEDNGGVSGPISSNAFAVFTLPAGETGSVTNVIVSNNNSNLFAVQPSISLGGTLTFTLAANTNGSAVVTVQAQDDGGTAGGGQNTSAAQTFTIMVTAVNDAPSFTLSTPSLTVLEDAASQTVAGFVTGISGGPTPDEAAQNVGFIVSNNSSNKFTQLPAINGLGTLTYTLAPNANGTILVTVVAQDNGGTLNGGVNTSAPQTFSINVTPVNDPPTVSFATNNLVVLEDAGLVTAAGFATFTLPADEVGQSITSVGTVNNNNALFAVQPSVALNGTLTFVPAFNAFGSAVVSVTAVDDGGTANGGQNTSAATTFTITVTAVNDAPSFSIGANPVGVLEDSGAATFPGALALISAGPGESQSVSFLTSNNASNLFTAIGQPVIGTSGTLTFTPAPNANGMAVVSIRAIDSGDNLNGGTNGSAPQTLTIIITNVNDAPIITFATNNLVRLEDSGAYSTAGFATFSAPADELGQALLGYTVSNSSNSLFSVQPALTLGGALTFTPAANAFGVATVTVVAQDDGGTLYGGVDKSTNTFLITLTGVNDAPTISLPFSYVYVETNSGGFTTNLGPVTTVGPANEASSQTITEFTVSNNQPGLFSIQPYVLPNGDLNFTLANNASGIATLTIRAKDSGGTANGGVDLSAPQSFYIFIGQFNVAPSFNFASGNVVVLEDAGPQTVMAQLTDLSSGDVSEVGQSVTVTIANDNSGLFLVQPALTGSGATRNLTFTPKANSNGVSTVTIIATDDGTPPLSTTNSFTITVTAVNDAPSFALPPATVSGNLLVNGSFETGDFTGWVHGAGAGDSVQVSTAATDGTRALLINSADQTPNGTLSQTFATIPGRTYTLTFDYGTLYGNFTQPPQRLNVQVSSSDLAPQQAVTPANGVAAVINSYTYSFVASSASSTLTFSDDAGNATVSADGFLDNVRITTVNPPAVSVAEDAGPQSSAAFATLISAGPPNESAQVVSFVVANNNNSLFSSQPAISSAGTLTFTPATNASGSATVTVYAQDNGGTSPGVNTSASQTFTITVTPVNDAPSATFASNPLAVMKSFSSVTNIPGFATFSKGPADESGQTITSVTVINDNNALFTDQPTINPATGELAFKPAGMAGTATVTVTTVDNGGTANGGQNTGTSTFVINVVSANIYVAATAPVSAGNTITVPVNIVADGDENGVGFTLTFDPTLLTFSGISAEPGLTLVANSTQVGSGRLGVVLSQPTDATFGAGDKPMIAVTFTVANTAPAGTTPIGFSSVVAYKQVTDKNANILPYIAYTPNVVTITALATGIEGDVTPRPTGNGSVTVSDAVQIGRFAAGLDSFSTAPGNNEFQRADCAPLGTQGDGRVTVADWVQSLRFAAGLDTPGAAGGPTLQATALTASSPRISAGARAVRVASGNLVGGRANTVSVQLDAQGNEAGLSLSLVFDATALSFVSATTGSGATGGSLMVNSVKAAAGKIGLVLVMPAGSTIAAGTRDVVTLTFNVTGSGSTAISVTGDSPVAREVADVNANVLGASFVGGSFNIILPAGLKAAGMERAADGSLRLVVRNSDGTPMTTAQATKYQVWVTSNLGGAWAVLPNALVVENGALKIVDPAAGGAGLRLYKLVETP